MPRMAVQRSFPILRTRDLERLEAFSVAASDARRAYAYEDDGRVVHVALEVGASTVAIGFEPGAGPPEAALWSSCRGASASDRCGIPTGCSSTSAPKHPAPQHPAPKRRMPRRHRRPEPLRPPTAARGGP